ncbi:hypothetical protein BB779_10220 [Pseudomonas viridiflava]|nr:hypothetical protein BB779_10220 [Pseudomonas viridiflava]
MPASPVSTTTAVASAMVPATAVVTPSTIAAIVAAVIAAIAIVASEAVVTPAVSRWAARLVVARSKWWTVITRSRGVVTGLLVVARLRRHVDAPLLVIGGAVAIVKTVPASDHRRRLGVHIGFVVTRASITTSKEESQQNDKRGSSIHGGLLDRDRAQTSDAGRRPPKRLADEG